MCLFNMPNTKDLVQGKKCGNGFLEDGEECDCGELEECTNPCCNPQNCTLKAGAECAHGDCCASCKLKAAGTMCREPAGSCDLPEHCTGASPYCPTNVYLMDGTACSYGEAYCNNGMCMTHHQQCVQLWGPEMPNVGRSSVRAQPQSPRDPTPFPWTPPSGLTGGRSSVVGRWFTPLRMTKGTWRTRDS